MAAAKDEAGVPHFCMDETATVVGFRWFCNCPGGPYFPADASKHDMAAELPKPTLSKAQAD